MATSISLGALWPLSLRCIVPLMSGRTYRKGTCIFSILGLICNPIRSWLLNCVRLSSRHRLMERNLLVSAAKWLRVWKSHWANLVKLSSRLWVWLGLACMKDVTVANEPKTKRGETRVCSMCILVLVAWVWAWLSLVRLNRLEAKAVILLIVCTTVGLVARVEHVMSVLTIMLLEASGVVTLDWNTLEIVWVRLALTIIVALELSVGRVRLIVSLCRSLLALLKVRASKWLATVSVLMFSSLCRHPIDWVVVVLASLLCSVGVVRSVTRSAWQAVTRSLAFTRSCLCIYWVTMMVSMTVLVTVVSVSIYVLTG